MSESYTIVLTRRLAGDEEMLRTHTSTSPEGAETLVESLIDHYGMRDGVVWDSDVLDSEGCITGFSTTEDAAYLIRVTPPLAVAQS